MRLSLYGRQPCTLPISVFDLLFKSDYSQPAPVCQEPAAFLPAAQLAVSRQPRRGMAAAAIRGMVTMERMVDTAKSSEA